ncbi:MAG: M14 family zinc carboxypeptidase [Patescibacteria group bacterium]
MKNIVIIFIVALLAVVGIGFYFLKQGDGKIDQNQEGTATTTKTGESDQAGGAQGTQNKKTETVIGTSVEGRDITAYHYGLGDKELIFIGGIHGGYEWNAVLVAYELMDYLQTNPEIIPQNIKVTIIPVLNPDGLSKVVGAKPRFAASDVSASQAVQISGRFNANKVDLNRNFDCKWKSSGVWQNTAVSGGSAAFSEPESQAIKIYIEKELPAAVVSWDSAAGGVYSSSCSSGISAETSALTKTYANASGYPSYKSFDFYETTGGMADWLAKKNIPAVSVFLTNHKDVEWEKNLAGVKAVLKYYAK